MLSKSQLKLITSLRQKKYRVKENLFIAEGVKVVNELINSDLKVFRLFCTSDFEYDTLSGQVILISNEELKKISTLKTPNKVLGLFEIPNQNKILEEGLIVALDEVNDPGNLGTIIRLCDWFGVKQIVCSTNTVDCYNSKVVQASMGSLSRVQINYTNIKNYISKVETPIFTTEMNGQNVYEIKLPKDAVIVMGNEANGISQEIFDLSTYSLSIPRFGEIKKTESLNVATATAILLSEFKRG